MSSEPQSDRLPFEPTKNRKKPPQKSPSPAPTTEKSGKQSPETLGSREIPDVVSQRMLQRMALFCGVPTVLGISTFISSYVVVSQGWFKLPNPVVVILSMGFFGLGVLGLTYGVLSASWDEEISGSKLGGREFATNLSRMTQAWRSGKTPKTED